VGRLFVTARNSILEGCERMIEIVVLIIGLMVGVLLCYIYMRGQLRLQLERWKSEFEEKTRQDILERSRAALKGRIGEQLAPLMPMFKHEPADARFLGSPVDYVIFDGYKDGEPKGVTFLDVKTGKTASLSPIEKKIKLVIEQGKVSWETVHVGSLEEEPSG